MYSDVTRPAGGDAPYGDDPMYVEESATSDGRRLLYFTFGLPDATPPLAGATPMTSGQSQDDQRPQEQG
jgi:hypothetical protein